ncbi:unnamed protein product [Brassicogethes aeneus]|uniref:Sulfhydryl oxidase n=1 Tax=Brassicogethes aeneus TaxID=1431903 RepID=A0A9P0AQA7_BRAAE|nr:unnamed protein product [Brassicogethes aeneus]
MSRRPSPLDSEQCRQCSSFSDYVRQTKKKDSEAFVEMPRRPDCPLDKDELGSKTWGFLHTMAAKYPKKPDASQQKEMKTFFTIFSKFYPCDHCAEEFREELKQFPPKTESQEALSQWLCKIHNVINVKTGKKEFDCTKVNQRWRDGWIDGSCD